MNKNTYLKGAGVLLLTAVLLLSATAVTANTNQAATNIRSITEPNSVVKSVAPAGGRTVIWDNGLPDSRNGVSIVGWSTYTREVVDDVILSSSQTITGGTLRLVLYGDGDPSTITGMTLNIYNDNSGVPSTTLFTTQATTLTAARTGNMYFSRHEILVNCTFTPIALAVGTWWIGFYDTCNDNAFWLTTNKTGTSQIYAAYPDLGYPKWTPGSTIFAGAYYDVSFTLSGGAPHDTTPPVTTCTLNGTMSGGVYITPVTATLTATDDMSGVNYTDYKVDAGAWTNYTAPFVISTQGAHIITFYSVDKAGNKETDKTANFTIQYPIQITIKGGFGITATIKNNSTAAMTNISWKINLSGGFLLVGKTPKTGTITTLAAGASAKEKDMVFGFGKTTITVTAGGQTKTATGIVLLFFVIGVK
jgi:hypothetical protein